MCLVITGESEFYLTMLDGENVFVGFKRMVVNMAGRKVVAYNRRCKYEMKRLKVEGRAGDKDAIYLTAPKKPQVVEMEVRTPRGYARAKVEMRLGVHIAGKIDAMPQVMIKSDGEDFYVYIPVGFYRREIELLGMADVVVSGFILFEPEKMRKVVEQMREARMMDDYVEWQGLYAEIFDCLMAEIKEKEGESNGER